MNAVPTVIHKGEKVREMHDFWGENSLWVYQNAV